MSNSLKIIFAGTGNFALYHLTNLLSKHQIVGILTSPDRIAGRGKKLFFSAIKQFAIKHNISLFQPQSECLSKKSYQKQIADLKADIMVVIAYGIILPPYILNIPRLGCINVHSSLLPRWRGAAPIPRSIIAGDKVTGVTTIKINRGIDTGDILHQMPCVIEKTDTSATVSEKLSKLGSMSMLITLEQFLEGKIYPQPQVQSEHTSTYAKKIRKEEARLNWKLSAIENERYIRAFNPWPVSYFFIHGKYIKVWKASVLKNINETKYQPGEILLADKNGIQIATAKDILNIEELQPAGKKIMKVGEFLNSRKEWFTPGLILD
ncbi:MAG: methionyl-tRNA formyltransferase [Candidatus Dasytiphilus stammeri]